LGDKNPQLVLGWILQRKFEGDLILPNLFLGSVCRDKDALLTNNITHILTVSNEFPPAFPDAFTYMIINAFDSPATNLVDTFHQATEFIDSGRKKGSVFVHCAAGISRSPTIVAAYLLVQAHVATPTEAIAFLQTKRSFVSPNSGFMEQLNAFHAAQFNLAHPSIFAVKSTPKPTVDFYHPTNPFNIPHELKDLENMKKIQLIQVQATNQ